MTLVRDRREDRPFRLPSGITMTWVRTREILLSPCGPNPCKARSLVTDPKFTKHKGRKTASSNSAVKITVFRGLAHIRFTANKVRTFVLPFRIFFAAQLSAAMLLKGQASPCTRRGACTFFLMDKYSRHLLCSLSHTYLSWIIYHVMAPHALRCIYR